MLVVEALADGRQAHSILNECGRMAMAELVQGAVNTSLGTVGRPARLKGLAAERLAVAVLHCPEQRPVPRLRLLEVAPQQVHQLRVAEQHGATMTR